jgi:hypothetical protein
MKGRALLSILLALLVFVNVYAQEPRPFGLVVGKTTKNEALSIMEKEGARMVNSGYRVIKGDIANPNIEGIDFKGLPVENLSVARLWFFNGILFQITYIFPLSMGKDEFYVLYEQLKSKYGKPARYVKPWLAEGVALWKFKDIEVKLSAPWVSTVMYLNYTNLPLSRKADESDKEVMRKETSKPQKGF